MVRRLFIAPVILVLLVGSANIGGVVAQAQPSPGEVDWVREDIGFVSGLELGSERVYAILERSVVAFDRESGDVEWQQQVVGENQSLSSPIATVAHGQLVVAGGFESPIAVGMNASDGTVEWRRGVARPSTDVVPIDRGFVLPVAPQFETQLLALGTDGGVLWRDDSPSIVSGLASTEERVFVAGVRLRAHRASDGSTTWVSDESPRHVMLDGGTVYAYVAGNSFENLPPRTVAYEPRTGVPTVTGNMTEESIAIGAYASRGTTLALRLDRFGEPEPPRLQVIDVAAGEIRVNRTITEPTGGLAVGEETVYVGDEELLTAYDATTGERRWKRTVGADVDTVVTDGSGVFAATFDGVTRIHTRSERDGNGTADVEPVVGADPPTDPDGDGRYEDVNGNGAVTLADVTALFANRGSSAVTGSPDAFDFNENGQFSLADVTRLFGEL